MCRVMRRPRRHPFGIGCKGGPQLFAFGQAFPCKEVLARGGGDHSGGADRDALGFGRGDDPVHFGIIVTLNLAIGQQTPPVASVLITACSIAKAGIWETTRTNLPFIGVLAFILLLVTYVPQVSLGLVGLLD